MKVIVSKDNKNRVSMSKEEFKKIIKDVTGQDFSLSFE